MTLIDPALLPSLEAGGRAKKEPMAATLQAFDGAIADLTPIAKTAAEWFSDVATILAENQVGLETDTGKFKFGNGADTFNDLVYSGSGGGSDAAGAVTWPVTPPQVVDGVMAIGDDWLALELSNVDGVLTLESRAIPLINELDTSAAFEVRLAFGSTAGGEIVAFRMMAGQTGAITIVSDDDSESPAGEVDGAAEITPPTSGIFTVVRLAGSTKNYESSINDNPTFRGQVTAEAGIDLAGSAVTGAAAAVITRGAGSSQPTAADSGAYITTDGNLTIPNSLAGWNCTLEFDANRTLTFNSQTWASGAAAGDIATVFVKSSSVIRITPLVAAADITTEADFA